MSYTLDQILEIEGDTENGVVVAAIVVPDDSPMGGPYETYALQEYEGEWVGDPGYGWRVAYGPAGREDD